MEQLKAELAELASKMQGVVDAAKDGNLSAEQAAEYDKLEKEYDAKKVELDAAVANDERLSRQEARIAEQAKLNPRKTAPDKLSGDSDGTKNGGIRHLREGFEDDPQCGFKDHRDFLTHVMNASMLGQVDNRLKFLRSSSTQHLTAGSDEHGEYSNPYGNFFVPKAFSPEQLKLDPESDPMAGLVRAIPMEVPSISFNARVDKNHSTSVSGGLRVYRRKETQTVSSSRMEHEQVELKANALFGVAYATEELLERSMVSFIALLDAGFSDEFNAKLVNERLNGTGTGEFEGVLNSASKITVTAETGQAASTILKENIDQMQMRIWRYGSAVWLANHGTRAMLKSLVQAIGTGGIAVPYYTTNGEGMGMLDGRPIYFTEFCPALGTEGDLLLCNWSEYLEGTLSGRNSAESMHVRFLEHERTFKFWMENDAKCWWRSAFTPKNGPTRSPIVTLATRS